MTYCFSWLSTGVRLSAFLLLGFLAQGCAEEAPQTFGETAPTVTAEPAPEPVVDNCLNDPIKVEPGLCGCGIADTDQDKDGTPDCQDGCVRNADKLEPGLCGCDLPDVDSDGDGTLDCDDQCSNDPNKIEPGICGCDLSDEGASRESDCEDLCPDNPMKRAPQLCGCDTLDTDEDGDGKPICEDACDTDPAKTEPGVCGCGEVDDDSDADGVADCNDDCPADGPDTDGDGTPDCADECPDNASKILEGACGCAIDDTDTDTDGDGTADCIDACPDNPDLTEEGACGCEESAEDGDGDGEPDCTDECPDNPDLTEEGACGCDSEDSDEDGTPDCEDECPDDPDGATAEDCGACPTGEDGDSDEDGVADCLDVCPDDPDKTDTDLCGCGEPDTASGGTVLCEAIAEALVHRYSFEGTGSTATDSAGTADGDLVDASQSGGVVTLDGTGYVDLPNGLISDLTDVTIEAWFSHTGSAGWERVFDFGNNSGGEDEQGTGTSYLFYTPTNGTVGRAGFLPDGATEVTASGAVVATGRMTHIAVVFSETARSLRYYEDGALRGSGVVDNPLSDIDDVNNWLGRSQFASDPGLTGTIEEFRIYDAALTAPQVSYSYAASDMPPWLD